MVNIHLAYTEPVNPAGASPTLTRDQIWRGLQRKIRRAQDFIAVVEGCDIVSDAPEEVVRVAHFKAFAGKPPGSMKEVCRSYWPTRVWCLIDFLASLAVVAYGLGGVDGEVEIG
jgi:hypothetical protein